MERRLILESVPVIPMAEPLVSGKRTGIPSSSPAQNGAEQKRMPGRIDNASSRHCIPSRSEYSHRMKLNRAIATAILQSAFLAGLVVWLGGCATTPKVDWNSRIGHYTHDQALLELGPPDRSAVLTDGSKVVEWLVSRGDTHTFREFEGPYYRQHRPGQYVYHYSTLTTSDYYLRLSFGPDGQLQTWKEVTR
jgi:hypothetical protein